MARRKKKPESEVDPRVTHAVIVGGCCDGAELKDGENPEPYPMSVTLSNGAARGKYVRQVFPVQRGKQWVYLYNAVLGEQETIE